MRSLAKPCALLAVACATVLLTAAAAAADPPLLLGAGVDGLHPTATFSAARAVYGTVYLAASPERAADGSFATPLLHYDLTGDELAAGVWTDPDTAQPGTYWLLLDTTADFDSCWEIGYGWDPTCPDGWSANAVELVVPRPAAPKPRPPARTRRRPARAVRR